MKIFYVNKLWGNIRAITLFPIGVFSTTHNETTIRHESIHWQQQKELLCIPFYLWYCIEALLKWSYYNISFEREAYDNAMNINYLKERKHYAFLKYIIHDTNK